MRALEQMAEAQILAAQGQREIAAAILAAFRTAFRAMGQIVARGLTQTPQFPL